MEDKILSEESEGVAAAESTSTRFPTVGDLFSQYLELQQVPEIDDKTGGTVSFRRLDFEDETSRLRREVRELQMKLADRNLDGSKSSEMRSELDHKNRELFRKDQLRLVLKNVNTEAQKLLLSNDPLQEMFLATEPRQCFVMSVDIRRSTELMLKARTAIQFASFVTDLAQRLGEVIKINFGVFDKFTGDGILAFFPDFFSGIDAGYYAINAAQRCHEVFTEHYRSSRTSFISVLKDVGLGIGIDYGAVHLLQVVGSLTVIGAPVVYACRMSGAPAGCTYLNQPGYEKILERTRDLCTIGEKVILIKNEGETLCYQVTRNDRSYQPEPPEWMARDTT